MYEVLRHHTFNGEWTAEYVDEHGRYFTATFTGPNAEHRARDYADWMNGIRVGNPKLSLEERRKRVSAGLKMYWAAKKAGKR